MWEQPICKICNKNFSSMTNYYIHLREKHTFKNTILYNCTCCLKDFNSVIFNNKLNKFYTKCEECRDLQLNLRTNDLVNNTFVYATNQKRYFIDKGNNIQACCIYTCNNLLPCELHNQNNITECNGNKCNNCFIKNGLNQCDKCIEKNFKSKDLFRSKVKDFKIHLGGKCVDCDFNELFFLEFDHIDSSKKTIQITRSSPLKWEEEKHNLELRCGRCHRIKTERETKRDINLQNKHHRSRLDKRNFVKDIKIKIGGCQLCNWNLEDKEMMCSALDFDHLTNDKYKQISRLYSVKKETIIQEILKTRLLCRHCHELHTCLQRGGKALKFYYTEEEIANFKKLLNDKNIQDEHQKHIQEILLN